MGDRISIMFIDGDGYKTPQLYVHCGGFAVLKEANRLLMDGQYNDFNNLLCNLTVKCMGGEQCAFGTYLYNDTGNGQPACDSRLWAFHETDDMPNGWSGTPRDVEGYWTSTWCVGKKFSPEEIDKMIEEPIE